MIQPFFTGSSYDTPEDTPRRLMDRLFLKKVMTEGKKILAKGTSIVIFPQNTRMVEFIPGQFNTLGIKLAKSAGLPVVPVAIKTDFWGNGKILKDLGVVHRDQPIHMFFGSPFSIKGNGKDEHQQVTDYIIHHLRELGGVVVD